MEPRINIKLKPKLPPLPTTPKSEALKPKLQINLKKPIINPPPTTGKYA